MDKSELYKMLNMREAQFEKAKEKRLAKTILAYSVAFFLLLCLVEKPTGIEYVWTAIVSVVIAVIHIVVNAPVFSYLVLQGEAERKNLEDLRKQLSE